MDELRLLNSLPPDLALAMFLRCCGSRRWAQAMVDKRPFAAPADAYAAADEIWRRLKPEDWKEAFSQHPKIGDRAAIKTKFQTTAQWAAGEQAGAAGAAESVLDGLAAGNKTYEERFGYIFIVCATGKSAFEMLKLLKQRLLNEPEAELEIAAEEQAKITRLRLEKLFTD